MSDTKQTYPLPALLVFPFVAPTPGARPAYWDQVRIRAVTVQKVNGDKALVTFRVGTHEETEVVSVARLASTPENAIALLTPQFNAMLALPALAAIAEAVAATEAAS